MCTQWSFVHCMRCVCPASCFLSAAVGWRGVGLLVPPSFSMPSGLLFYFLIVVCESYIRPSPLSSLAYDVGRWGYQTFSLIVSYYEISRNISHSLPCVVPFGISVPSHPKQNSSGLLFLIYEPVDNVLLGNHPGLPSYFLSSPGDSPVVSISLLSSAFVAPLLPPVVPDHVVPDL